MMVIYTEMETRNNRIAEIIRDFSSTELVGRQWLDDCYSDKNRFRNAFCDIKKIVGDVDLAWWYIAYGQSFGKLTDPMHEKMALLCKTADKDVITFQKDLPVGCKYRHAKDTLIEKLLAIDFKTSPEKSFNEIKRVFQSEKYCHQNVWCSAATYNDCQFRDDCPLHGWITALQTIGMPYTFEKRGLNSRAFFYFDTMLLIQNSRCSNFSDLFGVVDGVSPDQTMRTIILRDILHQVRGISIKVPFFLQKENQYNFKHYDEAELVYVDTRAVRVATRMEFPGYDQGIIPSIKKMISKYNLTANQMDSALYGMGDVCDEKNGCTHGLNDRNCIFYEVCLYDKRRI